MDNQIEIEIIKYSKKGHGIGFFENKEIEVCGTIIGEKILAKILSKKTKKKYKGKLISILLPSQHRETNTCKHVGMCGGCCFQQINYKKQFIEKQEQVKSIFSEINIKKINEIIPCDFPMQYRNKMEFSFSQNKNNDKFLGLTIALSHGYVLNITECFLSNIWFIKILQSVRTWWENSKIAAYISTKDIGSLRTLTIRKSLRTKDKMVILTVSGNPKYALTKKDISTFVDCIKKTTMDDKNLSIFLRIQQTKKGSQTQFFEIHLFGKDHIEEILNIKNLSFKFKISPTSFFQTNTYQSEKLYSKAIEMMNLSKNSIVFDLYCGTATLGIICANISSKIIAIDINPYSICDAKENIKINNIVNMEVFKGDVGKFLKNLKHEKADIVILDPPRAGLDGLALKHIKQLNPNKILYISCNPKTQLSDIKNFIEAGYILEEIQPVDQFPHTNHIENIALLKKY